MNLHLIDSTLREGLQASGGSIFHDEASKYSYIDEISEIDLVKRFEIYMPGPHIHSETWQKIMTTHKSNTQVYVGPAHKFDISERKELSRSTWPMISTTLIKKDASSLTNLSEISEATGNSPLRVGIECAGEVDAVKTIDLVESLGRIAGVAVVNMNDSNSQMSVEWIDNFVDELAGRDKSEIPRLGFHLHNGEVAAAEKARRLVEALGDIGLAEVEFDATAHGLGDRQGILSVFDFINLSPGRANVAKSYEENARKFVAKSARASSHRDSAASHYDEYGKLRPEYL